MSSDAHHAQANKVGRIALIVGLIFTAIAAIGLLQGWNDGDARPFMGWLLGLGFLDVDRHWHDIPDSDLVCLLRTLASDHSPSM